jgi:FtsP/CotA-like multicopper oxidase with cupredoxin domain
MELTIDQMPDGGFKYGINGKPYPTNPMIKATVGETQVWTVTNKTKWSHPMHIHGFFFQVLDDNGNPVQPIEWKDTVDVPFEQTRRFIVKFDDDRPGMWMYHCHILDHADGGLMGMIDLRPRPESKVQDPESVHHHD